MKSDNNSIRMTVFGKASLLSAFSFLILVSCSQDEDFAPQTDGDAVKINATIGTLPQTRLAYGTDGTTTFASGDQIRVINSTRSGKSKSDATYKFDGSAWTPTTDTDYVVWDGTGSNTFYGVYPATAEYATFTIPYDQSGTTTDNQITAADWMTASYIGANPDNNTITLAFKHLLTKVTINIATWNSEFPVDGDREITNPEIYTKNEVVTVSYGTGTGGADVYTLWGNGTDITPLEGGTTANPTYTAIVAPAEYAGNDYIMSLDVNDETYYVFAHNNTALTTDGLQPGKHYTFDLTVGKEKAEISSVTVTDWIPQTIDGGVAE